MYFDFFFIFKCIRYFNDIDLTFAGNIEHIFEVEKVRHY